MPRIARVRAREVLDSRGQPTVEVDVHLDDGSLGRALVPAGASRGSSEAVELRDGDATRYGGKGVLRAVRNVNEEIAQQIVGLDPYEQAQLDRSLCELDGTPNKSRLGANAILGVSLAVAKAAASSLGLPLYRYLGGVEARTLPLPMVNIISGGLHAGNNVDVQDFLVVPLGAQSYGEALHMAYRIYQATKAVLKARGYPVTGVADEGGLGPDLPENEEAIRVLIEAIELAGYRPGSDVSIAIDMAATQLRKGSGYQLRSEHKALGTQDLVHLLQAWSERYPIISIEDGLAEEDWDGWRLLTDRLGKRVQLVGDDLFATNPRRLGEGIDRGLANAILIKPNQIGTLTETLQVIELAHRSGYLTVISARSGETEDTTIADLAVATNAGQIKIGSVTRSERLAKYNQLLRIEQQLGACAIFPGRKVFARFKDQSRWG